VPPYYHPPLSSQHDKIRLLRLLPHQDENARIQCELFKYPLQAGVSPRTHLFEALPYIWGDPKKKLPISMHEDHFDVTPILHAALTRLRNHSVERITWIDAVCINQEDQSEKAHQIQYMTHVYVQANRVTLWLGEPAVNSDLALKEIRSGLVKKSDKLSIDSLIVVAVLALFRRPWFRRSSVHS
jgi:hypothetical protein